MAAGRPVVTTEAGGAREAVVDGESGFVVPVGDDQALADRIVLLLNDKSRARAMGARGRLIVESNFSCTIQLDRTIKLYERLLLAASRSSEGSRQQLARSFLRADDAVPLKHILPEGADSYRNQ